MRSGLSSNLARTGGAILGALLMVGPSSAQSDALVGTWRLVSVVATTASGERDPHPYGPKPSGLLSYMPGGRMSAIVAHDGRRPLSGDRISAPSAERAEAYATFFAYAGSYRIEGNRIVHHVEVASVPNWVGTDQVRVMVLHGDRLTLTTPPVSVGGRVLSAELSWERAK